MPIVPNPFIMDVKIDISPVSGKVFERPARRPKNASLVSVKLQEGRSWQEALEEYLKKL